MPDLNVLVAVPSYRGDMKNGCAKSLILLSAALAERRISSGWVILNRGDIAEVRNEFAARFLDNAEFTHLLMIDNDMEFRPQGIFKMLGARKPYVAWVTPRRPQITKAHDKLTFAMAPPNPNTWMENGVALLNRPIGTGIILLAREVFERMKKENRLRFDQKNSRYGFFDRVEEEDGSITAEDIAFGNRWLAIGGETYGLIDEPCGHIGEIVHTGSLFSAGIVTEKA